MLTQIAASWGERRRGCRPISPIALKELRTPKTTARELISMETALTPISAMIDSRQIIYHAKKSKPNNDAINQKKDTWDKRVRSAMSKYKINPADLEGKKKRDQIKN